MKTVTPTFALLLLYFKSISSEKSGIDLNPSTPQVLISKSFYELPEPEYGKYDAKNGASLSSSDISTKDSNEESNEGESSSNFL